ncbi:MAG: hypothetical protein HOW73_41190 [Polyangiaceae bacterium]|nr:hypothetical protein [Polyangiaceae bacterium]
MIFRDFVSSEDGVPFLTRIEQMHDGLFSRIPNLPNPCGIGTLFVVVRADLSATAYINEPLRAFARARDNVQAGAMVMLDDILDVDRLMLPGPAHPHDAVVSLLSHGWRRSLYFDFSPLHLPPTERTYDLERLLGLQQAQLLFQHRTRLSLEGWQRLLSEGWFPFSYLRAASVQRIIAHAESGWPVQELLADGSLDTDLRDAATKGSALFNHSTFQPHLEAIERGFERFASGDYISATSILYPRIEGVLRSLRLGAGANSFRVQELIGAATPSDDAIHLMPTRFREFLDAFCFRHFAPGATASYVSRHTVAHGVADPATMDRKAAAIAVLTLLQIALFAPRTRERAGA